MHKIALITGATSGIGEACAKELAALGYSLILTGRRADRLQSLKESLCEANKAECYTLSFDIRTKDAVQQAWDSLPLLWKKVDVLINNAGLAAGLDLIHEANTDDWEAMIDTNIKGLLYISRLVTPGMTERQHGHIINIGSIAGKEVYAKGNVYCATKHAVDALTRGMRLDLVTYGIKVTAIHPGAAETEFSMVRFKGDKQRADAVYNGWEPLYAPDIAQAVVFAVTRPPHVNIDDMLIMATAQAGATTIHRNV